MIDFLKELYFQLFPNTAPLDWFLALMGFILHHLLKFRHIPIKQFDWDVWKNDNLFSVILSILTILLCLSFIPLVYSDYSALDSLLIGASSTNIIHQIIKRRETKLMNSV